MKGNEQILQMLNDELADELTARAKAWASAVAARKTPWASA